MWEMVPNCSFKTNRESRRILKMADFIKSLYVFAWCSACNHYQISTCEFEITGQSHIAQLLDVQRTLQIECSRFLKLLPLLIRTYWLPPPPKKSTMGQRLYRSVTRCSENITNWVPETSSTFNSDNSQTQCACTKNLPQNYWLPPPPKKKALWASDYYVTIYAGPWTWIWCQDNQWSYIHCSWNLV